MADQPAPQPGVAPQTTEISPAEGDELVSAMKINRAGVRNSAQTGELAANSGDEVDEREEVDLPRPPPIG